MVRALFHNIADFEAYFYYLEKVENAYLTWEVLTDAPVINYSLVVNFACQSDSSTENASEFDRF